MPSTLTTETNGSGIRFEEEGVANDAEAETFETDERSNRFNLSLGNLVHLASPTLVTAFDCKGLSTKTY